MRQPDHAKHQSAPALESRTFFWEPDSRQRGTSEFQDRDHQSEQGNEPAIAATHKNDLLLQLS